jgi:hypothetical protein
MKALPKFTAKILAGGDIAVPKTKTLLFTIFGEVRVFKESRSADLTSTIVKAIGSFEAITASGESLSSNVFFPPMDMADMLQGMGAGASFATRIFATPNAKKKSGYDLITENVIEQKPDDRLAALRKAVTDAQSAPSAKK